MLTDAIFGRLVTPRVLGQRGFERKRQHGLQYYAFEPESEGASDETETPLAESEAILFLHGVGVGPAPYIQLLESFISEPYPVPPVPRTSSLTGGRATAAAMAAADRATAFARVSRRQIRSVAARLQGSQRVRRLREGAEELLPWELITAAGKSIRTSKTSRTVVTRSASAAAAAGRIAAKTVKPVSSAAAAAIAAAPRVATAGYTPDSDDESGTAGSGSNATSADVMAIDVSRRIEAIDESSAAGVKALTARGDLIEAAAGRPPRVIAVEIPQACQRIEPRPPLAPDAFADAIERVLEAEGVERVVVVGHSLGSACAWRVIRTHPRPT